jgi:hypothetical protein
MIQNAMMIFNRYYSNYRATNSSHLLNDLGNVDVSNLPRVNPDWLAGFSDGVRWERSSSRKIFDLSDILCDGRAAGKTGSPEGSVSS